MCERGEGNMGLPIQLVLRRKMHSWHSLLVVVVFAMNKWQIQEQLVALHLAAQLCV